MKISLKLITLIFILTSCDKDNYIKILFDRLKNKNRPHVAAKIKKIRVINPNKN